MRLFFSCLLLIFGGVAYAQISPPCCGGYNQLQAYTGQVATRSFVPDANDTTNKQVMSRSIHWARDNITSLKIEVPNFYDGCCGELGNGGAGFVSATVNASVEYPFGTCTQILFSGGSTGTMGAGVTHLLSDSVTVTIPNGAQFAIRIHYVGSGGGIFINNNFAGGYNPPIGDQANISTSSTDQTVTCGAIPQGAVSGVLPPLAIVATTTRPSVCYIGDSIAMGSGINPEWQNTPGHAGILAPSIQQYGYIGMAVSGLAAANWAGSSVQASQMYKYCSVLLDQYGNNDLNSGQTVAQLEGNLQTIYTSFSAIAASPKTIVRTTLTPHSTSSDNFATTVNQTQVSWETSRATFNNDVRAGSFYTGAYVDVNAVTGTASNYSLWKNPVSNPGGCGLKQSGGGYWTGDGIHPTACGNMQIYVSGVINTLLMHR